MLQRSILTYGALAGVIIVLPFLWLIIHGGSAGQGSVLVGYLFQIMALSLIFVAVKRHRDLALGGVIRFLPALGIGLGISLVAGVIYVAVWDAYLSITHYAFVEHWAAYMTTSAVEKGASPAAAGAKAAAFKTQYMNPLYRWPMTLVEVLPVGVLISVVAAGLLRFRRFLPARGLPAGDVARF